MRILYHHRTLADGAEGIHIAEMVAAFRELGHDVRVIGLGVGKAASEGPSLVSRLRHRLPEAANELAGFALNAVERRSVTRVIDDYRPDFMYKRHARNDVAALAAARSRQVPSVLEVNCLYSSPSYLRFEPLTFRRLTASLERRALTLATRVVAVSSPLAAEARLLGATGVTVLPNGANPDAFTPSSGTAGEARKRLGLRDVPTIGWAGIIRDWHGLELVLDALRTLPGVQLLVIGDGPARTAFAARAGSLGLADRVVVTGRVPHAEMARSLAALDVAVVADERTGIASPMKLLEYMGMGLAVVAPDAPNIRDIVTPDVDGVLFRAGDADDLARAFAALIGQPEMRQRLGRQARVRIERERNWRRNAERVLDMVQGREPIAAVTESTLKGQHV